jgi:hypothetical protein
MWGDIYAWPTFLDSHCERLPPYQALLFAISVRLGPLILPGLDTLSCNKICATTVTSLCDFVSTREAAGHRLRSLYLPANIVHDEALADSLSHLRKGVEVRYRPDDI